MTMMISGLLYYFGEDLSYFVRVCKNSLGCNSVCASNVEYSHFMFTLASILFDKKVTENTSSNDIAEWPWSVIKDTSNGSFHQCYDNWNEDCLL